MKKIVCFALASCVSMGTLYAAPVSTDMQQVITQEQTVTQTVSKENFIKFVSEPRPINYLHKSETPLEWILEDIPYVSTLTDDLLEQQIQELYALIEIVQDDYIMVNQTKVYGFNTVAYIDALESAVALRVSALERATTYDTEVIRVGGKQFKIHDKTNNLSSYSSTQKNNLWQALFLQKEDTSSYRWIPTLDECIVIAEGVYEALTEYDLPSGLTDNLRLYILPYYLYEYLGFTTGYNLEGREEQVFIAGSISGTTKEQVIATTLHELGHVFDADTEGTHRGMITDIRTHNLELWEELKAIYPEYMELSDEEMDYNISESFAEHFRVYIQKKNLEDVNLGELQEKKALYPIFERLISNYKVDTSAALPTMNILGTTIQSYEFDASMPYRFKGQNFVCTFSDWDLKAKPLSYKILLRDDVNNSAITLKQESLKDTTLTLDLETGHYGVLIYRDGELIRFLEFDYKKTK